MNGVAHYLIGLLITVLSIQLLGDDESDSFKFTPQMIISIIVISFFSHMLMDALAHFTYHPSETNWSDPVYTSWQLSTYFSEAGFAIYFLRTDIRYTIGMLSSVGFDLWDWSIRRPLFKYADIELPGIHWLASGTEDVLFGELPTFRNDQWALIVEVIFVIAALLIWRRSHNNSELSTHPRKATWKEILLLVIVFGTLRLLTLV